MQMYNEQWTNVETQYKLEQLRHHARHAQRSKPSIFALAHHMQGKVQQWLSKPSKQNEELTPSSAGSY